MTDSPDTGADLIPPASWIADRARDTARRNDPRPAAAPGVGPLTRWCLALMGAHPGVRRFVYRTFFQQLARHSADAAWWTCMNYGYAPLDGLHTNGEAGLRLGAAEAAERTSLQLYDHVAGAVSLAGREVLEVSCGRGGGAAYLRRHLGAARVTGLDVAAAAVAFCRRVHNESGLTFRQGDAEALPFAASSFDAVVNIEASFCYGDFDRFLGETNRVLRPGGYLLFADLRLMSEATALRQALARSGLDMVRSEDITPNVLRALEIDNDRRVQACNRNVPRPLRGLMRFFVGAAGTRIPLFLADGRMRYLCFALRKPEPAAAARPG